MPTGKNNRSPNGYGCNVHVSVTVYCGNSCKKISINTSNEEQMNMIMFHDNVSVGMGEHFEDNVLSMNAAVYYYIIYFEKKRKKDLKQ